MYVRIIRFFNNQWQNDIHNLTNSEYRLRLSYKTAKKWVSFRLKIHKLVLFTIHDPWKCRLYFKSFQCGGSVTKIFHFSQIQITTYTNAHVLTNTDDIFKVLGQQYELTKRLFLTSFNKAVVKYLNVPWNILIDRITKRDLKLLYFNACICVVVNAAVNIKYTALPSWCSREISSYIYKSQKNAHKHKRRTIKCFIAQVWTYLFTTIEIKLNWWLYLSYSYIYMKRKYYNDNKIRLDKLFNFNTRSISTTILLWPYRSVVQWFDSFIIYLLSR